MANSTSVAVLSCGNVVEEEYVGGGLRRALWQDMHVAEVPWPVNVGGVGATESSRVTVS